MRKRRKEPPIEPYLGDIIGGFELIPPLTLIRRRQYDRPRWLERGVSFVVLTFGLTVISTLIVMLLLFLFTALPVRAHDAADWINKGGYKNKMGELCCGKRDCVELGRSDVREVSAGYYVIRNGETVPFSEATPSPTGTYWYCQWDGKRKCFFYPPASM